MDAKETMAIMICVVFLSLISFAVIYNTLKGNVDQWYWGLVGALVIGVKFGIKWLFKK